MGSTPSAQAPKPVAMSPPEHPSSSPPLPAHRPGVLPLVPSDGGLGVDPPLNAQETLASGQASPCVEHPGLRVWPPPTSLSRPGPAPLPGTPFHLHPASPVGPASPRPSLQPLQTAVICVPLHAQQPHWPPVPPQQRPRTSSVLRRPGWYR